MRRRLAALAAVAALVSPTVATAASVPTQRVGGADRYSTAVAMTRYGFPSDSGNPSLPRASVLVVASATTSLDGLAAGPVASMLRAPLLLVPSKGAIPASVAAEVRRVHPSQIWIVGGTGSVSAGVAKSLKGLVSTGVVRRMAGADRYSTASTIARWFPMQGGTVYVAGGASYPDALAAAGAAGSKLAPLVLTQRDALPAATRTVLARLAPARVVITGGPAAVSPSVEREIRSLAPKAQVVRAAGRNRYETAAAVSGQAASSADVVYLASGQNFPDALGGAALAGTRRVPLLLARKNCVPAATLQRISAFGAKQVVVLGGTSSLSGRVADLAQC